MVLWAACGGGGGGGGAGGGSTCHDPCSQAGATRCAGTSVQTCQADSSGCLAWSAAAACPSSGLCSTSAQACVADPCNGVSTSGVCTTPTEVSFCGVATGESEPRVLNYDCASGETCQVEGGTAKCVLSSACSAGESDCADATTLRTCDAGTWQATTCSSSCRASVLGAFCAAPGSLTSIDGRVLFEARAPDAGRTDWSSTPGRYPAPLFLVMSLGAGGGIHDAVYTSADPATSGRFSIQVPAAPVSTDRIVVAAAADNGAGGLAFAVANPGFPSGGRKDISAVGSPALWSWSWPTSGLTSGQDLVIAEAMGSGAANAYYAMLYAYAHTYARYQQLGPSLVIWVQPGVAWSCGSCFAPFPSTAFGLPFASQIWIGGDPVDQGFWSDAVNEHELGHWAMASYGISPREGGPHFVGRPTFPGQAWSEGWATWFSSAVRGDPVYYDKQGGSFFWLDLGAREYSSGEPLVQPVASDGLLQLLDENTVAAMMWTLSSSGASATDALFQGLVAPRMTSPTATRGYTRHQWSFDAGRNYVDVVDTGQPAPSFPDFLDALDCAGFSRAAIEAATVPASEYPYPSASPICN